jgi:radical SAM protein with 4Fe4S-binding SPASM domain
MRRRYPNMLIQTDFDILSPKKAIHSCVSPEKASCPAGRSRLNIQCDGTIYPCSFLVTSDRRFAVGQISDGPILRMWHNSPVLTPFRTMQKSSSCQNCEAYGDTCAGGCVAMSYLLTGDLHTRDPLCFVDYLEDKQGH